MTALESVVQPHDDGETAAERWKRLLTPFRGPDTWRSVRQLTGTVAIFFGLWIAMLWSLDVHYGLTLLLALPAGGFLMRLFMIQHDCGHGSYFRSRRARDAVGFCIGVLTLIPYQYWRRTHAYHHAHSGDLDLRGFGDIDTLTVREYLQRPRLQRVAYRVYRHPLVLLGIGPLFHFVVKHRYPWDVPRSWKQAWRSVWWTNLAVAAVVVTLGLTLGWQRFFMVHAPITVLTCSLGVYLFYVQHQFENTYWHDHEDWDYFDAAIHGSSHMVLPRPLQWITAHIGLHHVHHLNATIPNYKLEECLRSTPELQTATQIRLRDSWKLLRLTLWDEEARKLIGFRDLRRQPV